MSARIYRPTKSAMQSGTARGKIWALDYDPDQPREVEPLMGWTSSGDMRQQVHLRFDTKDEAIAYAERHGIPYRVYEDHRPTRRTISYADNFAYGRPEPWSH